MIFSGCYCCWIGEQRKYIWFPS